MNRNPFSSALSVLPVEISSPHVPASARVYAELRSRIIGLELPPDTTLVRNDLAKTCLPGSVQVDDLFGIYPFETVFQMISTISGRIKPGTSPIEVLRQAFPMGSMTGAPKVKSMELIEALERSQRGLYSGALGYISPEGDFDFNVVIRSLLYNAATEYLAFQVGGAIVYDSIPEQEYEECLLKAKALLQSIHSTIDNKA